MYFNSIYLNLHFFFKFMVTSCIVYAGALPIFISTYFGRLQAWLYQDQAKRFRPKLDFSGYSWILIFRPWIFWINLRNPDLKFLFLFWIIFTHIFLRILNLIHDFLEIYILGFQIQALGNTYWRPERIFKGII